MSPDLPPGLPPGEPFRGSAARTAGLITPGVLRGPRFRRLFPDVYVAADVDDTLALRARAAFLLGRGRGAVGGYAAAELLGASCGPTDAPVDLVVPGRAFRTHPGLEIHRGLLPADETTTAGRIVVTTPRRTAYGLACSLPLAEAVVAVDTLAYTHKFDPADLVHLRRRHLGARGSAQLDEVLRLANRLSQSPMESRIRLAIVLDGLPVPVLQHPAGPFFLDLSYPALKIAIEYDGDAHRTQERAMRDLDRQAWLTANGWTVLRFTAFQVLYRPWEVVARVRYELAQAARRHGVALDALPLY